MLRFYHLDLALHLGGPRLSWRRLGVLLRQLPREAATAREVHGEDVEWTIADHLLAGVLDALNAANWQRGGDKKAPRPKPVQRPGVGPPRLSQAELQARLMAQRRRLRR